MIQSGALEDDWPESIFPQALIQPRRHLFTSLRRACLRAAMLNVYGHMRAQSHHPSFLPNCAARFLTNVVCASCIVPGCCAAAARKCSVQVALRKCSEQVALRKCSAPVARASALRMCSVQVGLRKLLCASCSVQALCACALRRLLCASALSKLLCASALRQLLRASRAQVALRKWLCPSCSASAAGAVGMYFAHLFFVLKSCDFPAGAAERLHLKVEIFQPELREHAPHTTFVLKSCDFPAGAAGARSAYYVCT